MKVNLSVRVHSMLTFAILGASPVRVLYMWHLGTWFYHNVCPWEWPSHSKSHSGFLSQWLIIERSYSDPSIEVISQSSSRQVVGLVASIRAMTNRSTYTKVVEIMVKLYMRIYQVSNMYPWWKRFKEGGNNPSFFPSPHEENLFSVIEPSIETSMVSRIIFASATVTCMCGSTKICPSDANIWRISVD